jgi:hypothetical protein
MFVKVAHVGIDPSIPVLFYGLGITLLASLLIDVDEDAVGFSMESLNWVGRST